MIASSTDIAVAAAFLERWSPDEHAEVRAMLTRLARDLVTELPLERAVQGS